MSKHALDFLKRSQLWRKSPHSSDSDRPHIFDLQKELIEYREHIVAEERKPSGKLSVTVGARQGHLPDAKELKRSVMYFDEVLLPDPLFKLTDIQLRISRGQRIAAASIEQELASALQYIGDIVPLIELGRVRLVPSTQLLEAPESIPLLSSEDSFASEIPRQLQEWFSKRVRVRKVAVDNNHRYVLQQGPDADTRSINIDFGQLGAQRGQDFMTISAAEDGKAVILSPATPRDSASLDQWVKQSVNKAAADFLHEVLGDANFAWGLSSSYITSCEATASLLDHIRAPASKDARAAFSLELPIVESATFKQLAELLDSNSAAFEAFRFELKAAAEVLTEIDDETDRQNEAKKIAKKLERDQVNEVDRKLREANRRLKWNVPIVVASLVAGAVGFAAGTGTLASAIIASLMGTGSTLSMLRDHQGFKALPGYFLWKLKRELQ